MTTEESWAGMLGTWWCGRRKTLMRVAVVVMIIFAAEMLSGELWRLVLTATKEGAVDLKPRHAEVHRWFSGLPVYTELKDAVYPPASYALLWPLLGGLPLGPARWLWASTSIPALAALTVLIVRQSKPKTVLEGLSAALMVLSMNAVGPTIGNGQLLVTCCVFYLLESYSSMRIAAPGGRRPWRWSCCCSAWSS